MQVASIFSRCQISSDGNVNKTCEEAESIQNQTSVWTMTVTKEWLQNKTDPQKKMGGEGVALCWCALVHPNFFPLSWLSRAKFWTAQHRKCVGEWVFKVNLDQSAMNYWARANGVPVSVCAASDASLLPSSLPAAAHHSKHAPAAAAAVGIIDPCLGNSLFHLSNRKVTGTIAGQEEATELLWKTERMRRHKLGLSVTNTGIKLKFQLWSFKLVLNTSDYHSFQLHYIQSSATLWTVAEQKTPKQSAGSDPHPVAASHPDDIRTSPAWELLLLRERPKGKRQRLSVRYTIQVTHFQLFCLGWVTFKKHHHGLDDTLNIPVLNFFSGIT